VRHNYTIEQVLALLGSAVVEGELLDETNLVLQQKYEQACDELDEARLEIQTLKSRIEEMEGESHDDSDAAEAPAIPAG